MLKDESLILIENRKRFQAKQQYISAHSNQKYKQSSIRPIREETSQIIGQGNSNNRRPKSNFSTTNGVGSHLVQPQDITIEQAFEMLSTDPTVFMAQTHHNQSTVPIVTGQ